MEETFLNKLSARNPMKDYNVNENKSLTAKQKAWLGKMGNLYRGAPSFIAKFYPFLKVNTIQKYTKKVKNGVILMDKGGRPPLVADGMEKQLVQTLEESPLKMTTEEFNTEFKLL